MMKTRATLLSLIAGFGLLTASAAVRNLALQLKHYWKNLDYTLNPTTP